MPITAIYYTDPACPWSWSLEPLWRRLERELGGDLAVTYVMGGLARELDPPERWLAEWVRAGGRTEMPVDARLWLESPPASSYPACLAVEAAGEQSLAGPYLRRLREGFACRRRKLDTMEALLAEARAVPGLDIERFRIDLGSNWTAELFGKDLDRSEAVAAEHHDPARGRVRLPSVEFVAADGAVHGVYGAGHGGDDYRDAALAAGAQRLGGPPPDAERALREVGPLAVPEVAALCDLPGPRAPAELWRLAQEWRARPERLGSGELWSAA